MLLGPPGMSLFTLNVSLCTKAPPRSRINFSSASDEALKALADVCEAATFGINDKNVLDETYRKAGKLDSAHFSAKFDPVHSGLLGTLKDVLLEGHGADKVISAELYKLNIYGTPLAIYSTDLF